MQDVISMHHSWKPPFTEPFFFLLLGDSSLLLCFQESREFLCNLGKSQHLTGNRFVQHVLPPTKKELKHLNSLLNVMLLLLQKSY